MRSTLMILAAGLFTVSTMGTAAAGASQVERTREPVGPTIRVVTSQRAVSPGGLVAVDVFVSNVTDLSVYQVELEVAGGARGRLSLEDLRIDTNRPDYVFGAEPLIKAEAKQNRQIGAMLFPGSVDAGWPAYLGTYTFRASLDAAGTFTLRVSGAEKSSFLLDSRGRRIACQPGKGAAIAVGKIPIERIDVPAELSVHTICSPTPMPVAESGTAGFQPARVLSQHPCR